MSSVVISGDTSGAITISAPAVAGTNTLTLPADTGTVITTASSTGISGSAISSGTVAQAYGGTGTTTGYYGFKNRIINGAMVIDQRNAGVASANTINGYFLDRWQVVQSVTGKLIAQQNAGSVTPPVGFSNYLGVTSQSAYSVAAGDYYFIVQYIEGFNFADCQWGTSNAKTITLSFWAYSSLTGTFGGSLRNATNARSYPFTYTISSANTWTQISVTIAGDTTGTWVGATNGIGVQVLLGLGVGSTFSGTAGSWAGANYMSATSAKSVVGTNGATFYITGVQLEVGSTATSFDYRPYGTELALCQRYYENVSIPASLSLISMMVRPDGYRQVVYPMKQTMRATPTATFTWNSDTSGVGSGTPGLTQSFFYVWSASQIATSNLNPYITALSLSIEL